MIEQKNVISEHKVLDKGYIQLIDHMGGDDTIVSAARVSYLGESKGEVADKKLVRFMMKHGHTSPFEHVIFQWRVKCPLFVRSQWHRHRTWSYNELSRRYTSEDIEFYRPSVWRPQDDVNKQGSQVGYVSKAYDNLIEKNIARNIKDYEQLIMWGVSREMARMVLPQNMYTTFYGTVDLHNLMHFIDLRADSHAQWEIQIFAKAMLEIIEPIVPWTIQAWREINEIDF